MRAPVLHVPTTPPKAPHCGACLKTLAYLQQRADVYECARVDCPTRKGVTAAPCERMKDDDA